MLPTAWRIVSPLLRLGGAEQQRWLHTAFSAGSAGQSALPAEVPSFKIFQQMQLAATPTLDAKLPGERRVYIETYGGCTGGPAALAPQNLISQATLMHCRLPDEHQRHRSLAGHPVPAWLHAHTGAVTCRCGAAEHLCDPGACRAEDPVPAWGPEGLEEQPQQQVRAAWCKVWACTQIAALCLRPAMPAQVLAGCWRPGLHGRAAEGEAL